VSTGNKLASLVCFSVTSSKRAPLAPPSPSRLADVGGIGVENAGSSFETERERRRSRTSVRTREPSGDRRKSEVSFKRERSGGEIRDEDEGDELGGGAGKPPPVTRVRSSSDGVGGCRAAAKLFAKGLVSS
jgi:hypothetical protein